MESTHVNTLLISFKDDIPNSGIPILQEKLKEADDSKFQALLMVKRFQTVTIILLSLFLGCIGVDRFYIGDNKKGGLKLGLTIFGVVLIILSTFIAAIGFSLGLVVMVVAQIYFCAIGIFFLVDIFKCMKASKEKNLENILNVLKY